MIGIERLPTACAWDIFEHEIGLREARDRLLGEHAGADAAGEIEHILATMAQFSVLVTTRLDRLGCVFRALDRHERMKVGPEAVQAALAEYRQGMAGPLLPRAPASDRVPEMALVALRRVGDEGLYACHDRGTGNWNVDDGKYFGEAETLDAAIADYDDMRGQVVPGLPPTPTE